MKSIKERVEKEKQRVNSVKTEQRVEDIQNDIFFSHRRLTGQGIVGRLYEGLKGAFDCFLDSEAHFKLNELDTIIKNSSK